MFVKPEIEVLSYKDEHYCGSYAHRYHKTYAKLFDTPFIKLCTLLLYSP